MLAQKLLAATSGAAETLYVDDVFQTVTRTGTGASATTTTGFQPDLVWTKQRTASSGRIFDSARGVGKRLVSDSTTNEAYVADTLTAFGATGYTYGADATIGGCNYTGNPYVDWVWKKAPKFLDVVTWTGNATNRTISHSLGQEVGLIFVKRTDATSDWQVYHRSLVNTEYMVLNSTAAKATGATRWNSTTPTTSVFSVGTDASVNASGGTYVAYLFAHDTGVDGIIQCGSFTVLGSAASINLDWEPQYVMMKRTDVTGGEWYIFDTARGWTVPGTNGDNYLWAQASAAEATSGSPLGGPTATGFNFENINSSGTFIYLAIRRPNKPPTVGTQVYNAIARTGTGAAATVTGVGFAPDLVALHSRSGTTGGRWEDRLRGATIELVPETTAAETTVAQSITSFSMDGFALGTDGDWNTNTATYINHFFKRAPGVFDIVAYTGTGAARTVSHGLGVVPEMIIAKGRSAVTGWSVFHTGANGGDAFLYLNQNTVMDTRGRLLWGDGTNYVVPTVSSFTTSNETSLNGSGTTFVAYLFATKAGISKVGSYTGNGGTAGSAGTSQTIDCGFTTGARFVLLKCTSHTSDWVVVDTVRGLIAGNDPALSLNTTAAEVTTTDLLDADTSGFIVNQLATGTTSADFNVTSRTYIYLAFS